jgi:hypothetical protein
VNGQEADIGDSTHREFLEYVWNNHGAVDIVVCPVCDKIYNFTKDSFPLTNYDCTVIGCEGKIVEW